MARKQALGKTLAVTIVAWIVGLLMFFPISGRPSRRLNRKRRLYVAAQLALNAVDP